MKGTLYLIPCPISDETAPWDVLPAANKAVMDGLDYFIVENTRTARRFLSKAGVARPIDELEFRELNEHTAAGREVEELIAPLLAGRSAGVISEAGVPGVCLVGWLIWLFKSGFPCVALAVLEFALSSLLAFNSRSHLPPSAGIQCVLPCSA